MEKKRKYFWLISIFCSFQMACSLDNSPSIASIGKTPILFDDYEKKYLSFLEDTYQADNLLNRQNFLNTLIDEKLLLKHATYTGIKSDSDLKRDLERIHDQIILNHYFNKKIKPFTKPTEIELRKLFSWYKTELHVRHIYARSYNDAIQLHHQLSNGKSWELLAFETFQDSSLKENGGDLGWRKMGELDPSFEAVAFTLKDGEISLPVRTETGFSIIQVIERKQDLFLTETEFQREVPYLELIAENYKKMPQIRKVTDEIKARLKIHYNFDALNSFFNDLINSEEFNPSSDQIVLTYKDQLNLSKKDVFQLLNQVSKRQYKKLNTVENLERIISGLLVRGELLHKAKEINIHQNDSVINETIDHQKRAIVKYVLNTKFYGGQNSNKNPFLEDPKVYQTFRDSIANEHEITINHDLLKSFVLPIREEV